ncbi:MAG TPA: hypothetical protein VEJ63_01815, partial [Planctomycetota bacterium]|nr:hypothetical protein [Planctomycetota bacterium]
MHNRSALLIKNAAQLVTLSGPDRARAGTEQGAVEIIADGAVLCQGETILDVGATKDVLRRNRKSVAKA